MSIDSLMRQFTIRFRMLGAIAVVLLLLGVLGGAGMLGMFRMHALSQDFVDQSFSKVGHLGVLRGNLGTVRQHEKDMIINYEKPEAVQQAHVLWQASLDQAIQTAQQLKGDADSANAQGMLKHLAAYRELFGPVVRQLEANGYDTATVANRMSAKAVAEFVEADKLMGVLDADLRREVDAAVVRQNAASTQTQWLFALAVLVTVVVVVPLTLLNMQSICRPLADAQRMALAIAGGDLSQPIAAKGR